MHPLGPSHGVFGTFTLGLRKRNEVKGHTPSYYLDIPYKHHICVCIGWFKSTCLQFFGHVLLVQIPISHHFPRVLKILWFKVPVLLLQIPHLCTCCWLKCCLVPATCQGGPGHFHRRNPWLPRVQWPDIGSLRDKCIYIYTDRYIEIYREIYIYRHRHRHIDIDIYINVYVRMWCNVLYCIVMYYVAM